MLRELDTPGHLIQDNLQDLSSESMGRQLARVLMSIIEDREIPFDTQNTRLLSLGVGHCYAELKFAERMGILPERVLLLDKEFSSYTKGRLREQFSEIEVVERGMFDFLSDTEATGGFSMVTLIGVEYVARKMEAAQALADGLGRKMIPGGIVMIVPCGGNMDTIWEQSGFEVIEGFRTWVDLVVYRYAPKIGV
jgi:hypothetical protein